MIIDAHVHVLDRGHWPDAWWDHVAADWASRAPGRVAKSVRPRIEAGLIDPDGGRMIAQMDAAGVAFAVNLPIDWGPDYPASCSPPEMVAQAVEVARSHNGRLIPFAGIDPRRDGAAAQLEEWIKRDGVAGLKLYPPCGWWPADERAMELYELCATHDLPVLFHTGAPLPLLDAEYGRPKHLLPVVQRFPELRLWVGHAGHPNEWEEALAVVSASRAASLELSCWVWGDADHETERRLARRVAEARDRVGIERVIFGSDNVSGAKERRPGFLATVVGAFTRLPQTAAEIGITLTREEHDAVMFGNAARDLQISTRGCG